MATRHPSARTRKDAKLDETIALPAAAGTVASAVLDLGNRPKELFTSELDVLVEAPALTTAQLPDTKTAIYDILGSASDDKSSPVTLVTAAITQTGAGGAGDVAAEYRYRPPGDVPRYIWLAVTTDGAVDASAAAAEISVVQ